MRLWGHTVQRRQLRAHHPATQTSSPGTPVGGAALPPAWALAVDGESHVPNSLRSLHSAPKPERCRISACLFMLSSGTKHCCFASNASYFGTAPSLLAPRWSIPDRGSHELAGIERRSMQTELLSMPLQDDCRAWSSSKIVLFFPLHCLCISQVWCPQRQLLSCARELMWHAPGHVFLQFYIVLQFFGFSLELQLQEKGKKERGKRKTNLFSLLAVKDSLFI